HTIVSRDWSSDVCSSDLGAHLDDARISVALDLAQRLGLHVVEGEAVILEPLLELVALRALLDDPVGDGLDAGIQPLLRPCARLDHRLRELRIDGEAAIVDFLIEMVDALLELAEGPRRHALRQLAHRDDVVKRVLLELEPFDRMLVGVRRALAEQLNQLLAARCLLCVFAEREYLAEQVQLARQTMGVGARPRAVPSGDRWHGERPLVHGDDAIELRVMRDDLHVRCSPRHHEVIRRVESRIPYASRTVVDGVGHKANARLRMPRIAVEADVLGATTVQGTGVRRNDLDIEVEAVLKSHRRSQVRLRALQVNVQRRQKPASVPARGAGPRVTARARHIGRAVRTPLAVAYDL